MGKIETGLRAVKPRVDLRLYRGLYSPFPAPPSRSGGTGRRAGFRSQWAQARGGSSPPFGMSARFWRLVDVGGGCGGFTSTVSTILDNLHQQLADQYLGKLGSTFTAHASIPPLRLRTFEK